MNASAHYTHDQNIPRKDDGLKVASFEKKDTLKNEISKTVKQFE